jgi:RND family efflux transporter MFP subunit
MKTHLFWILGLIFLASGCAAQADRKTQTPAIAVKTAEIQHTEMSFPIRTVGKITRDTEMALSFKIGGIIHQIYVSEGQKVGKGQLLASLKTTEIRNQALQAKNGLEKAERDFNRIKELYADKVATLEQYQNTETALNIARSSHEIARFNLKHARITAPQRGVVLHKLGEANELIGPGNPVVVLSSSQSTWTLRAGIADIHIPKIRIGDPANIQMDAYPGQSFSGKVSLVGAGANPRTGMFDIEVTLDAAKVPLFSGLIGSVEITPGKKQPVAIVPIEALFDAHGTKGSMYVPSQDGNYAVLKEVEILEIASGNIAVSKGLDEARQVITDGSAYLTDGAPIHQQPQAE